MATTTLDSVDVELAERVEMVLRACPRFWIASAYRSPAEQRRLYNGYINGLPGFNLAAKPGTSNHEKGLAVDIGCNPNDVYLRGRLIKECGLHTPVRGEGWHVELAPERKKLIQKKEGLIMPARVDALPAPAPYVGHWVLTDDGGVRAINGAPFFGSYPGLPKAARQGERKFIAIGASKMGGYVLYSDDDSWYEFNPK